MSAEASGSAQLFETLERFRQSWPKRGWSWDYRVDAVASSFHVELSAEARRVLLGALPQEWNFRTIANAPSAVRDIAETTGGVRTDQRLFSSLPSGRLIAYALWWPWGDEITISVRIGLAGYVSDRDTERLRDIFNALD